MFPLNRALLQKYSFRLENYSVEDLADLLLTYINSQVLNGLMSFANISSWMVTTAYHLYKRMFLIIFILNEVTSEC